MRDFAAEAAGAGGDVGTSLGLLIRPSGWWIALPVMGVTSSSVIC